MLVYALESGGRDEPWGSFPVIGAFGASAMLFVAFVVIERRAAEPLIPLDLFRIPALRASTIVTGFLGMSMFGVLSFIPLYGRTVLGVSATGAGRILIPLMLAMMVGSARRRASRDAPRLPRHRDGRRVGVVVGTFLLTRLTADSGQLELSALPRGARLRHGAHLHVDVARGAELGHRCPQMGVATGLVNFTRQLGGAVGVALGCVGDADVAQRAAHRGVRDDGRHEQGPRADG